MHVFGIDKITHKFWKLLCFMVPVLLIKICDIQFLSVVVVPVLVDLFCTATPGQTIQVRALNSGLLDSLPYVTCHPKVVDTPNLGVAGHALFSNFWIFVFWPRTFGNMLKHTLMKEF